MIVTNDELVVLNLRIDLRDIKYILETRPNIMASEYLDLCHAKNEIIKRLMKLKYDPRF